MFAKSLHPRRLFSHLVGTHKGLIASLYANVCICSLGKGKEMGDCLLLITVAEFCVQET